MNVWKRVLLIAGLVGLLSSAMAYQLDPGWGNQGPLPATRCESCE
jgi:hypothetical protein